MDNFFLRPNIVAEPLIDGWYAWPHLVSPMTAARNMTERHFRIMDSYIRSPEQHERAAKDPRMRGGPFMDYPRNEVEQVKRLKEETRTSRANLVALSEAFARLDRLLEQEAKGYSLNQLYPRIPEPLRGYVELAYDRHNRALFRVFEALLYRSDFYHRSAQSMKLSLISSDDRPFILSTPRLPDSGGVHFDVPFGSEAIDRLFRMKTEPGPIEEIAEILNIEEANRADFSTYFTSETPGRYERYTGAGIKWRYFGHACILIETRGANLLVDPVLSYTYDSRISRYTYEDLPERIDFVLITHNHQDHVLLETLLQLRHRIGTVLVPANGAGRLEDPSLRLTMENCGFRSVSELREFDTVPIEGGEITALPFLGEHADLDIPSKLGYHVRFGDRSLLLAADSCNVEPALYHNIYKQLGPVDTLFLGMECDGAPLSWLYGPLLTKPVARDMDQSRRLAGSNFAQAIQIVDALKCSQVYVYAMGQEPWLNYIMSLKYTDESNPIVQSRKLLESCSARGIVSERLFGEKELWLT